jgi:hypothetical protein
MHGVTVPMLIEAIDELKKHYSGQKLSRRLLWFRTLLGRTKRLLPEDKRIVEKEINMFEELLDDDPYLRERDERAAAQALQKVAVDIVRRRFPTLITLAEQRVTQISSSDVLQELVGMLSTAPDENTARFLLKPTAA